MSLYKDEGVTLRRMDYSETSQILVVFTRQHGKVRLIAKGVRRSTKTRVAPGIDLLEIGQVVWSRRESSEASLATLTEWRQLNALTALRSRLDRLYAAQYVAEIVALLTEERDPHPELYEEIIRTLTAMSTSESPVRETVMFQKLLLREVGLLPRLTQCAGCGRSVDGQADVYLSSSEGGVLCRDCEPAYIEKRRVTSESLAELAGRPVSLMGSLGAFETLDFHITTLAGRPTRLARFLISAVRQFGSLRG